MLICLLLSNCIIYFFFKVSRKDKLPKNICNGCLLKLEILYEFWNTTVSSEKQLLSWLNEPGGEAGASNNSTETNDNSHSMQTDIILKQEAIDVPEKVDQSDDLSTDAKSYILQQQQLPYETQDYNYQNDFTNSEVLYHSIANSNQMINFVCLIFRHLLLHRKMNANQLLMNHQLNENVLLPLRRNH